VWLLVMAKQSNLFEKDQNENALQRLKGFKYQQEFIERDTEAQLVANIRGLPFQEFDFHGFKGKRRVVSFGWRYDYDGAKLREAAPIPDYLLALRKSAATFAGMKAEELQQALITEYAPDAGIGWHRDKAVFGQVVGVSLLSSCVLRFRRKIEGLSDDGRSSKMWERVNVFAEPRSVYFLSGPARLNWEHSILRVDELRYAITFRSIGDLSKKVI
jgi:alkylated DNA repair dioxygenase AlkB